MLSSDTDALVSAPDARAYFLLLRQKKVAKEKATPGCAVGCADSPALLEGPGGCGTRGYAPQTVLADCPRPLSVARRSTRGPEKRLGATALPQPGLSGSTSKNGQKPNSALHLLSPRYFSWPLGRCRATQALADKGRGLSEGRSPEFRSPRLRRVAQGTRRSRAPTQGWPFLWLLSFGHTKESTPAAKAEYSASTKHLRVRRGTQP